MSLLVLLTLLSFLSFSNVQGAIVTMEDGGQVEVKALYSTLGSFFDVSVTTNLTIVRKSDIECDFLPSFPVASIQNHFLVFVGAIDHYKLFRKCSNYYFDSYGNAAFFARFAEKAGAIGVIVGYAPLDEEYSDYRLSGFTKNIGIPVLVADDKVLSFIAESEATISSITVPPIENKVLTAYFTLVDFRIFLQMEKSTRTIHPTLSKAAPFVSSLAASIWYLADPFSFKLMTSFPALFFERINFGFIYVTSCLLLKTWILAVGDKLKAPQIFKASMIAVNVLTGLNVLVTILWLGIGFAFRMVPVAFGAITAITCGVGFAYFGKDIVMILAKQQQNNGQHKNLSLKIVIFVVVFILFTYTCMILYLTTAIGATLTEFVTHFLLSLAFITIYSVLFFRKFTHRNAPVTPPASSLHRSKSSNSKNSNNSGNHNTNNNTNSVESGASMSREGSNKTIVVVTI